MPGFIVLAENIEMGDLHMGKWTAETAEDAVKKMKESDRTYRDIGKDQEKEDGRKFGVYEVMDYTQVRVDTD